MRLVTFQSVLWGGARLLGLQPARDLTPETAARLTEYANRAVAKGWRFERWPEWTRTEQRWYRPWWTSAEVVAAGDERFYAPTQTYYQALRAEATGQAPAVQTGGTWTVNAAYWAACAASYSGPTWTPATDYAPGQVVRNPADQRDYACHTAHTSGAQWSNDYFGPLTPFQKFVAYEQSGQAAIWEAPGQCAFRRDPRVYPRQPWPVSTGRNDRGITLPDDAPTSVWLQFWSAPPVFTSTARNNSAAYAAGVTLYDAATGDCWTSLAAIAAGESPTTTPAKWRKVEFPFVLAAYVTRAICADALRDLKQTDRALAEMEQAEEELQEEVDRALPGQGQYETATVVMA